MLNETEEKAAELWHKYFAVTQDMVKLLDREDFDLFMDLVEQRDRLINLMRELPANDYRQSDECQELIGKIKPLDMQLIYRAKTWLNKSRHTTSAVRSYDLRTHSGIGGIVNKGY